VLAERGGREDGRADVLGHRDRGLTGRARRGVHQHGLPRRDAAQVPERGHRRGPVHDEAQRLLIRPARRHGHRRGGGQHRVLGESTTPDADDVLPRLRAGHRPAHRDDLPRGLEARQVRRPRTVAERAVGLREISEVDACRADPDQHLALPGPGHRCVGDQAHVLRPVAGSLLQRAHRRRNAHE
jgi:hypothetical protein